MGKGSLLGRRSLVVVTGASAGIGRQIALDVGKSVAEGSRVLLTARRLRELEETAAGLPPGLAYETLPLDLADFPASAAAFRQAVAKAAQGMDSALLFHNAGTLGDLTQRAKDVKSADDVTAYLDVNLTSYILLNNAFLEAVEGLVEGTKTIVNITSLAAIKSLPAMSLYSTGKAAREAFLRSLAAEEPSLRCLSYSPGPVLTEMQRTIQRESFDEGIRAWSKDAEAKGELLTTRATVGVMCQLLEVNEFDNAAHVDYYDVDNGKVRPQAPDAAK